MKAKDLREHSAEELRAKDGEIRKELFDIQFQAGTAQVNSGAKRKLLRKDLARVLTILNKKSNKRV